MKKLIACLLTVCLLASLLPAAAAQSMAVAIPKKERPHNPFVDVEEGKYFYDAVLWAVSHEPQITNGMDDTHFVPGNTCTRGQVVTFLWRAVGKPGAALTETAFTDVSAAAYYYKAMLWAVENEITKGMTATSFAPDGICTRGQVVTFLHRTFE